MLVDQKKPPPWGIEGHRTCLCTLKSVVKELQSQLPKSKEVSLQKPYPAPFPPLPAQHLPLGSFLTFKWHLSHCNLHVNASGLKAFIFLLCVLSCTWEGPEKPCLLVTPAVFTSGALLSYSRSIIMSLGVFFRMEGHICPSLLFPSLSSCGKAILGPWVRR